MAQKTHNDIISQLGNPITSNMKENERQDEWNRQQRLKLASAFLDTILIPHVLNNQQISRLDLDELIVEFKNLNPLSGNDFTLDHVWGIAWARMVDYEDNPSISFSTPEFSNVRKAWECITRIQSGNAS